MDGVGELHHAQVILQVFLCNANRLYIAGHKPHCRLSAQLLNLPLQQTHAGFPGVAADHQPQRAVTDAQLLGRKAVGLELLGDQVALGDLHLLLVGVAGELDDLHAVQQRPGDGGRGVGSGDEHHVAQIHGDFQEMVPEGVVLLAVQHLQQRAGGVPPHVAGQLVDFVQHHQRIHGPAVDQRVNNAARHGADVRFPMAPDVRLVPHAAQAQPGQLAVHGLGHRDGDGGLAHPRRAHQADDLPLGFRVDLPHRHVFQNPLLHLVQAVVIPVQNIPGLCHVRPVPGLLIPGHIQAYVQIIADHRGLGAAEGLLAEAVHLFHQPLLHLLRQLHLPDFGLIFLDFLVLVVAQLMLQHLHLLPQDHVLLHLAHPLAHLLIQLHLQGQHLKLMGQNIVDLVQPLRGVQFLQNPLAVIVAQRHVLGDKVRQCAGVTHIQHSGKEIVVQVADHVLILPDKGVRLPQQRLHAGGDSAGKFLLQQLHVGLQKGLGLPHPPHSGPGLPFHHHPQGGLGGLDDL